MAVRFPTLAVYVIESSADGIDLNQSDIGASSWGLVSQELERFGLLADLLLERHELNSGRFAQGAALVRV